MELANRDEIERKLARVVGRGLHGELERLLGFLGDPPNLNNIPHDYWQNGWRSIQKDVEPILAGVFVQQALALMTYTGFSVDWDLVNRDASNWARQNTERVLNEMWRNRHDAVDDLLNRYPGVGEAVAESFEQGLTLGELRARLESYYGPVRAEMIAITETTRAAVEGERAMVAEIMKDSGIEMIPIWLTSNDERVCRICGPKHDKPIEDGNYPPAHPNCRCTIGYKFADEVEK